MENKERSQYLEFIENINMNINKIDYSIGAIIKLLDSEENFRDVNLEIIKELNNKILKLDTNIYANYKNLKIITVELDDFFLENKIQLTKLELEEIENKNSDDILANVNNLMKKIDLIVK